MAALTLAFISGIIGECSEPFIYFFQGELKLKISKDNKNEILIFLSVTIIVCAGLLLNLIEPLEVKTQDYRFKGALDQAVSKNIVLIAIDDEDLNKYGKWPLKRSIHGNVIDVLKKAGAAVIGIDIMFSIPSADSAEDEFLARAIREAGNVILAYRYNPVSLMVDTKNFKNELEEETICPVFSNVCRDRGFVNIDFDYLNPDGVLRNVELFREFGDSKRFSLPIIVAREFLRFKDPGREFAVQTGKDAIKIGENTVPLFRFNSYSSSGMTAHQCYMIKYNGVFQSGIFPSFTYSEVLEGSIPPDVFKGKVVLIGAQSAALIDVKLSPLGMTPGMYMNAQVIDNIIRRDFVWRINRYASSFIIILLGAAAFFYLIKIEPSFKDILALLVYCGTIILLQYLSFVNFRVLFEMVAPLVEIIGIVVTIRFYQLFIKLHLSNISLTIANKKLEQKVTELTALYDISKTITATPDTAVLFGVILKKTIDIVGAKCGAIFLIDEDDSTLKLRVSENSPPLSIVDFAGAAVKNRKIIIASREADAGTYKELFSDGQNIDTIMCIPLNTYKGELIGVIVLVDKNNDENFVEADIHITSVIATQAGFAIENANLYQLAVFDNLTTLYVRRYFIGVMTKEFKRVKRYRGSLSVAMTDIDHFKKFNDTYGHQTGDMVLREVAMVLKRTVRDTDIAARFGGEEFIVVLPETDKIGALMFAERLRKGVEEHAVASSFGPLKVNVSIGVATYSNIEGEPEKIDFNDSEELIGCADIALYKSKEGGRNRATLYTADMKGVKH